MYIYYVELNSIDQRYHGDVITILLNVYRIICTIGIKYGTRCSSITYSRKPHDIVLLLSLLRLDDLGDVIWQGVSFSKLIFKPTIMLKKKKAPA